MALITKENAAYYHRLSNAARLKRAHARRHAETIASAILDNQPTARATTGRLEMQAQAIHDLIMNEIAKGNAPQRLMDWVKAQRMIMDCAGRLPEATGNGVQVQHRLLNPVKVQSPADPADLL